MLWSRRSSRCAFLKVVLPGLRASRVVGVDILYGREQELIVSTEGDSAILKGMLIRDCPIALSF
jgi:hypothetical protein